MSTSTCCVCRWVGTLATANSACPRCGEKSFADGVTHAATFRTVRPEHPHLGVEEPVAEPSASVYPVCSAELTQGLVGLAEGTDAAALAHQASLVSKVGMVEEGAPVLQGADDATIAAIAAGARVTPDPSQLEPEPIRRDDHPGEKPEGG